jgi:hypothetical protein
MSTKDLSIEYAHIYTNNHIGDEQKFSIDILNAVTHKNEHSAYSLVVMVDDYSFPDPTFSYEDFTVWLREKGFEPNFMIRESQLIPVCDEVLSLVKDDRLKKELIDYIKAKRYPCSLFVAAWYLLRLGLVKSPIFDEGYVAKRLINILPESFKSYEDKAFDIIKAMGFIDILERIENQYFEGREIRV